MSALAKLTLAGGMLAGMAVAFYGTLPGGVFGATSLVCMLAAGSAGSRLLGPRWRELREARRRRRARAALVKDVAEGRRVT